MATQSPFSWLDGFLHKLPLPPVRPPAWAVDETQRRIVLLLNHILQQEPEACTRLSRQQARVVQLQWRTLFLKLGATPAGLLELAAGQARPDLQLVLTEEAPLMLAGALLRGDRPGVRIAGDVQLAAEVNWLVDHVRWDLEEDLARLIGDAPAHTLGQAAHTMAQKLRQFVDNGKPADPGTGSA